VHRITEKAQEELKGLSTELADAGYWSEDNMTEMLPTDPEFLIAIRDREAPRGRYLSIYRCVIGWIFVKLLVGYDKND